MGVDEVDLLPADGLGERCERAGVPQGTRAQHRDTLRGPTDLLDECRLVPAADIRHVHLELAGVGKLEDSDESGLRAAHFQAVDNVEDPDLHVSHPDSRTLRDRALAGFFWGYGSFVAGRLLVFAATVVLARLLQPEQFGLVAFALA